MKKLTIESPGVIDLEEGIGRNDLIPFAIDPGGMNIKC
jgi:hypothetical protein